MIEPEDMTQEEAEAMPLEEWRTWFISRIQEIIDHPGKPVEGQELWDFVCWNLWRE